MMMVIYFNAVLFLLQLSTVSSASQRWSVDAAQADSTNKISRRFRRSVQKVYNFEELGFVDVAVDVHNQARRTVHPTAADMREMSWDDELAALALAYSQQCVYAHNPSPQHSQFGSSVGENLHITTSQSYNHNTVASAMAWWNAERVYYDYDESTCRRGRACGHYTQMVWSSTYKVGCGATKCSSINVFGQEWKDATLLVCNYGPSGNFYRQRPYVAGVPCAGCHPNQVCSNNLCSN